MQKSKGSRSKIVFFMGKTGYTRTRGRRTRTRPVKNLPDPTRTRGYGSGQVYPRVRVDRNTSRQDQFPKFFETILCLYNTSASLKLRPYGAIEIRLLLLLLYGMT